MGAGTTHGLYHRSMTLELPLILSGALFRWCVNRAGRCAGQLSTGLAWGQKAVRR